MGTQVKFWNAFKFKMEIDGFARAGFQKVDGLEQGVEVIQHEESDMIRPDKSPGKFSAEDLTLEFGATDDMGAWNWFKKVVDAASGKLGVEPTDYKKDIAIVELDGAGSELKRWNVFGAFPFKFSPGSFDATSNEKRIRKLQLAYDYFEPVR